jgi:L-lactate dehydrogenase complex protein LldG
MDLARERILERVRTALRVPAQRPAPPSVSAIWPPMGDVETRFRTEFEAVKGELIPNAETLRAFLASFKHIATDGSELVRGAVGEGNADVREAELGVTGCDCLVAQTGSIVVSSQIGGRMLSVLPPVHLVIARREQLVPDLAAALGLLRQQYGKRWTSALSVITGPSRTADIEKILVMGAHGPKRLGLFFA